MKPWNTFRWSAVFCLILAAAIPFQNCSEVSFNQPAVETKTGNPPVKICVDKHGVTHLNGSTWSEVISTQENLPCPNSAMRVQRYTNTYGFLCDNGDIIDTGVVKNPENQVPACPAPRLTANITPPTVVETGTAKLVVQSQYVSNVSYRCYPGLEAPKTAQAPVKSGPLAVGNTSVDLVITEDLFCFVEAVNAENFKLVAEVKVSVQCGADRVKEKGFCQDFACKQIVALNLGPGNTVLQVPARSSQGLCYSLKIMDSIANGASENTSAHDGEIISRSHGADAERSDNQTPYLLGSKSLKFKLDGARNVRLNGSPNNLTSIKVDNYVLIGLIPEEGANASNQDKVAFYKSYGTEDARLKGKDYISFRNQAVFLKPFGPGGTSTIAPLDITSEVKPAKTYELDARALDCGGSRELSDIYLLFQ